MSIPVRKPSGKRLIPCMHCDQLFTSVPNFQAHFKFEHLNKQKGTSAVAPKPRMIVGAAWVRPAPSSATGTNGIPRLQTWRTRTPEAAYCDPTSPAIWPLKDQMTRLTDLFQVWAEYAAFGHMIGAGTKLFPHIPVDLMEGVAVSLIKKRRVTHVAASFQETHDDTPPPTSAALTSQSMSGQNNDAAATSEPVASSTSEPQDQTMEVVESGFTEASDQHLEPVVSSADDSLEAITYQSDFYEGLYDDIPEADVLSSVAIDDAIDDETIEQFAQLLQDEAGIAAGHP